MILSISCIHASESDISSNDLAIDDGIGIDSDAISLGDSSSPDGDISSMDDLDSSEVICDDVSQSQFGSNDDSYILDTDGDSSSKSTSNNPIYLQSVNMGNFEDLSKRINQTSEGNVLILDKDYKYENGSDSGTKGILISKSITIDGRGHTIDGNRASRIFNITAANVILKNINFINGITMGRYDNIDVGGGAIHWYGANGKVMNCNFTNNSEGGIEDDPFDQEEVTVTEDGQVIHMIRVRPCGARTNEGGAIVWRGDNGTVSNCIFRSNIVGYPNGGGAIYWRGNNGKIISSEFYGNGAWTGGAVYWKGDNGKIISSKFLDNGMFDRDIFWAGKNGTIRNSMIIHPGNITPVYLYTGSLDANYNFWGDTFNYPNQTEKGVNVSCWYILNDDSTNPIIYKGDRILVDFDDFLLVTKYGNVYDNESQHIAKINLDANVNLVSNDLTKYYKDSRQFRVKVYDGYGKLAVNKLVTFKINKHTYRVRTDKNGFASLRINEKPGNYDIHVQYGNLTVKNKVIVKNTLITKNISKRLKKSRNFNVKVLNPKGKPYANQVIKVRFRGKTFNIKTNKNGIASFKLSNDLKVGSYPIKVSYNGLTNTNRISVKN